MDATDRRILKRLQENSRVTVSVLSQEISLSMPAISERLKKLENTGVIQQYTAILDPELVDKQLMCILYISFEDPVYGDHFEEFIVSEPDVKECFYITGEYDYALKIITKNTKTLDKIMTRIKNQEGIARTEARLQNLAREIDSKFNLLEKITKADLEKHPAKNNSGISPQDRESVKTLKRQGWTVAEIARSLNFPESAVELILEMPDD